MSMLFVISGPSGTGKSTLVRRVVMQDSRLEFAVSVTTRPPRNTEIDGEAYHFVSKKRFHEMKDAGEFLEWAEVFGNYYGTPWVEVKRARTRGLDVVLDIDVQGASSLIKRLPDAVTVFVLPPSSDVLAKRLRDRSSDDRTAIERRLAEASREVRKFSLYDYVVVNDDIEQTVERLHAILIAERSKRESMESAIAPILASFGVGIHARGEETE